MKIPGQLSDGDTGASYQWEPGGQTDEQMRGAKTKAEKNRRHVDEELEKV